MENEMSRAKIVRRLNTQTLKNSKLSLRNRWFLLPVSAFLLDGDAFDLNRRSGSAPLPAAGVS